MASVTVVNVDRDQLSEVEEKYAFDILINLPIIKFDRLKQLMNLTEPGVLGPLTLNHFVVFCKDNSFDLSEKGVNDFKDKNQLGNTGASRGVIGSQTALVYFDEISGKLSGGGKVNRAKFFSEFRSRFENLSQSQVQGYDAIFDFWDKSNLTDNRWLAYVLATAFHETGEDLQPVREGFCGSDQCSINAVTRLFNNGRISINYALPEANGNSYFGRGLVQITFADNYLRLGQAIGIDSQLFDNPSLALDMNMAVRIMFKGMIDGLFTNSSLGDFFNDSITDWDGARTIINPGDLGQLVGDFGRKFFQCLS
jgi:Chitinase class I